MNELHSDKLAQTERLCREALLSDPNHVQSLYKLAEVLLNSGRPQEARKPIETANRLAPQQQPILFLLGRCLFELEDFSTAAEVLGQLANLEPGHPDLQNQLGLALQLAGKNAKALQHYDKALKLNPRFLAALNNKANLLGEIGEFEQARQLSKRVLALDPNNAVAHFNLGLLFFIQNNTTKAQTHFRRAVDHDPTNVSYLHNLGLSHASAGDFTAAQTTYERALRIAPNHTEVLLALCQITPQELAPDIEAVLLSQEKNIEMFDADHKADVFFTLAKLQAQQKNYAKAFDYYSKANQGRRARWPDLDVNIDVARMQEIIAHFTPDLYRQLEQ